VGIEAAVLTGRVSVEGVSESEAALRRVDDLFTSLERERPGLRIDVDAAEAEADIRDLVASLDRIEPAEIAVHADASQAVAELDDVTSSAEDLDRLNPTVTVAADTSSAEQPLREVDEQAAALDQVDPTITVSADTANASGELATLRQELEQVGPAADRAKDGVLGFADGLGLSIAKWTSMGAAGAAAGALLMSSYTMLDDSLDGIRMSTGATGDALRLLEDDFQRVGRSAPVALNVTADALGILHTRLGLTGDALQDATRLAVDFGRVNKMDVAPATDQAAKAINALNLEARDLPKLLDAVTFTAQDTGIAARELLGNLIQFGPVLEGLGFQWQEQIALMGQLEAAGLRPQETLNALRMSAVRLAAEGGASLSDYLARIAEARELSDATLLAAEVVGPRIANQFAIAVREGAFATDEFVARIDAAGSVVADTASDIDGGSEAIQRLQNSAYLAAGEIGTTLEPAIIGLAQKLEDLPDEKHVRIIVSIIRSMSGDSEASTGIKELDWFLGQLGSDTGQSILDEAFGQITLRGVREYGADTATAWSDGFREVWTNDMAALSEAMRGNFDDIGTLWRNDTARARAWREHVEQSMRSVSGTSRDMHEDMLLEHAERERAQAAEAEALGQLLQGYDDFGFGVAAATEGVNAQLQAQIAMIEGGYLETIARRGPQAMGQFVDAISNGMTTSGRAIELMMAQGKASAEDLYRSLDQLEGKLAGDIATTMQRNLRLPDDQQVDTSALEYQLAVVQRMKHELLDHAPAKAASQWLQSMTTGIREAIAATSDFIQSFDSVVTGYTSIGTQADAATSRMSAWERKQKDANEALAINQRLFEENRISEEQYLATKDLLTQATARYEGAVLDEAGAYVDAQQRIAEYTFALDELNKRFPEGERESAEYKQALLDLQAAYDPAIGSQERLADVMETAADMFDTSVEKLANLYHTLGLLSDEEYQFIIGVQDDASPAVDEAEEKLDTFGDRSVSPSMELDKAQYDAGMAEAQLTLDEFVAKGPATVEAQAETAEALSNLGTLQSVISGVPRAFTITPQVNIAPAMETIAVLRNNMPSSPAKEGPFSRLPDWDSAFASLSESATQRTAQALERVAMLRAGIDDTLGDLDGRPAALADAPPQRRSLADVAAVRTREVADTAAGFSQEHLEQLKRYADAASSAHGLLERTAALSRLTAQEIVQFDERERRNVQALSQLAEHVTRSVGESAALMDGDYVEHLGSYAQSTERAVALLDRTRQLSEAMGDTVVHYGDWQERNVANLKFLAEHAALSVGDSAALMDGPYLEHTEVYARATEASVQTLNRALDLHTALGERIVSDSPAQADSIAALKFMTEHATQSIGDSAALMESAYLEHTQRYAGAADAALGTLTNALALNEALRAVSGDLGVVSFETLANLKFLAEHATRSVGDSAQLFEGPHLDQVGRFANAADAALGTLGTTLSLVEQIRDVTLSERGLSLEVAEHFAGIADTSRVAADEASRIAEAWDGELNEGLSSYAGAVRDARTILGDTFALVATLNDATARQRRMSLDVAGLFGDLAGISRLAADEARLAANGWDSGVNEGLELYAEATRDSLGILRDTFDTVTALRELPAHVPDMDAVIDRLMRQADQMALGVARARGRWDEAVAIGAAPEMDGLAEWAQEMGRVANVLGDVATLSEGIAGMSALSQRHIEVYSGNYQLILDMVRELNRISPDYIEDAEGLYESASMIVRGLRETAEMMQIVGGSIVRDTPSDILRGYDGGYSSPATTFNGGGFSGRMGGGRIENGTPGQPPAVNLYLESGDRDPFARWVAPSVGSQIMARIPARIGGR
jgi:hypothetical protein